MAYENGEGERPARREPLLIALCVGALVALLGNVIALALGSHTGALGSLPIGAQPAALAIACAAALLLVRSEPSRRSRNLCAIALAAAVPLVAVLARSHLGVPLSGAPLPLAMIAAVTCAFALAPGLRAERIRRARSEALDAAGLGVLVFDGKGRLIEANGTARAALVDCDGAPAGRPGETVEAPHQALRRLLAEPGACSLPLETSSGRAFEASITERPPGSAPIALRVVLLRDVTTRRQDERRLLQLAHYDSLTGLANRRRFLDQLAQTIGHARGAGRQLALLYVDLDQFKEINDSLGHAAGDELLRVVAQRLQQQLRPDDVVAVTSSQDLEFHVSRLAGDEFAVLLPAIDAASVAARVAGRILQTIATPVWLGEQRLTSSGSVGVAIFPRDGADVGELVKNADAALYAAKRLGRNRYEFYDPAFSRDAERARMVAEALRSAIEREELHVHYQPKIDLATATVSGFEALLRWNSAELGPVTPKEFIPIAESRNLIGAIGGWCLTETCRQIRSWLDAGFQVVPVSVNVSSAQFRETDLRESVMQALRDFGLEPSLLEIELTESLFLHDDDSTALALRDLRAIGVRVALDDFGTGYSALTYLNRLPLDTLKMDRGFVRDIESSQSAAGVASAVVAMAHALGLEVVAEGVDSEDQLDRLREMACDQVQGFLYEPALPAAQAERFLARRGEARPRVAIVEKEAVGIDVPMPTSTSVAAAEAEIDPTGSDAASRVLMLDDGTGSLGNTALRLTRLGVDLHYTAFADEAQLFVEQEEARIRLLIGSPRGDLDVLRDLLATIGSKLGGVAPVLLIIGEEPDATTRERIRAANADWVLWNPFDDSELRFLVNATMARPKELARRREPRVPLNTTAWLRVGAAREVGVLANLSPRGAFIELERPLPVDTWLRVEFVLQSGRQRVFGRVVHALPLDPACPPWAPSGVGVVFEGLDPETAVAIRTDVEELALRYRP